MASTCRPTRKSRRFSRGRSGSPPNLPSDGRMTLALKAPKGGSAERSAPLGPYLLFLGDTVERGYAKTAFGLRDWAPDLCIGEFALPAATIELGLPKLRPVEAADKGARSLVIGVANTGGFIAESWVPALVEALEAGLDI